MEYRHCMGNFQVIPLLYSNEIEIELIGQFLQTEWILYLKVYKSEEQGWPDFFARGPNWKDK